MAFTPEFEQAIDAYIDTVIQLEKTQYISELEPFHVHEEKIRKRLKSAWSDFRKSYCQGYMTLLEEVAKEKPLTGYIADPEKLKNFEMGGEKTLAEAFGYTYEVLQDFYKIGYRLIENGDIERAFDVFFFLVQIAPNIREMWLNYGYTALQRGEHVLALEANGRAYLLDPTKPDAYLAAASVYLRQQDFEHALKACDLGISHSQENPHEPWAQELAQQLEEGKRQIALLSGAST